MAQAKQTKAQVLKAELDLVKEEVELIYDRAAVIQDRLNANEEAEGAGLVLKNALQAQLDELFE